MRFTRAELESFRDRAVPDLVGPGVRLVFVGINPSLWTAGTRTHFSHPGNRFYPALRLAGIIDRDLDRAAGMTDDDRASFLRRGIGQTNLVNRATIRADELDADELRAGAERLRGFVRTHGPLVVAVLGITAYRTAFGRPKARGGEQPEPLEGARLWVVPNPSGLNAHETTATLAAAYAEPARAAGILAPLPTPPPDLDQP
ncbi:MAG: G/U mismatch-specific uracil DNA glycosylase [uncultured Friedmanniella sp.]|uniref:G/U mismatch-specific uracil DNA glycosylase n=1 Tax=uncultured Friedmanniella sp. TaxID=335381 RepID=A0A6J4KUQ9_9ACTN|nr:MAG: G/U mismatch-specific uracil DNA glycosylase [uncultured Friedmanniella sp.]